MSFGIILSPPSIRKVKDISQELEWMQMEEHQPASVATGSGGMDTDDPIFTERVEPSSFVAALSISAVQKRTECPGDTWTSAQSFKVLVEEPEQVERGRHNVPVKNAAKLEFGAWPDFRNFRIWRRNFRSEVSSCASRPIEAMVCVNEMESAKSTADLKTSVGVAGAKLQTTFEVLDGLKKIINGDIARRVFLQEEAAQKKALFHWKASRTDVLRVFQGQRCRRIRLGPQ